MQGNYSDYWRIYTSHKSAIYQPMGHLYLNFKCENMLLTTLIVHIDGGIKLAIFMLDLWHKHAYTHIYRHVCTRCRIDNLHWPCFWLSYKQIFFDYVTVCCITHTRMTNQVWQSNAWWFCTDSAGVMKPPLFRHSGLWRRGPVTHFNDSVVPLTTPQSQVAILPYRDKLQLQFLSAQTWNYNIGECGEELDDKRAEE